MFQVALKAFLDQRPQIFEQFPVVEGKVIGDFDLVLGQCVQQPQNIGPDISAESFLPKGDVDEQHKYGLELVAGEAIDFLVGLDHGPAVEAGGQPLGSFSIADEDDQLLELLVSFSLEVGRTGAVGQEISLL